MEYDNDEIDLSLYKLFYVVYHSKTADILGVTQPSISYNIKRLEECLGLSFCCRE